MTQSVREFWNQRAALGPTAGTQDLILKQLEHRAILAEVNRLKPSRILEVGCGRGELAKEIVDACPFVDQYIAIDNSTAMIAEAYRGYPSKRLRFACCELADLPKRTFDCIITERMLINLQSEDAQLDAIAAFASRLVPGGEYLMCEHFMEGLHAINALREPLGLPAIQVPWHNRYLTEGMRFELGVDDLQCGSRVHFSADYYLLSRVVNAKLALDAGVEPDYNSPINQLALVLPNTSLELPHAMARLWVWRKA